MQSEAALQTNELSQVLETVYAFCFVLLLSRNLKRTPLFCPRRSVQMKTLLGLTAAPSSASQSQKPRPKQSKPKAEPPPKKRKKWKEEFAASESSAEEGGEEEGERAV